MWVACLAAIAAFYSLMRASGSGAAGPAVIAGLLGDALLFVLAGLWLHREAVGWHHRNLSVAQVVLRVAGYAFGATLLAAVALASLWWVTQSGPTTTGMVRALVAHGPAGFVADHLFVWMVAATAVPLPWIAAAEQAQATTDEPANSRLLVRAGGRLLAVAPASIDYVVSADNYLELHCGVQTHLCRMTMGAFVDRFAGIGFVRAGRGLAVNAEQIGMLETLSGNRMAIIMRDGVRLPVARRWQSAMRKHMTAHSSLSHARSPQMTRPD